MTPTSSCTASVLTLLELEEHDRLTPADMQLETLTAGTFADVDNVAVQKPFAPAPRR